MQVSELFKKLIPFLRERETYGETFFDELNYQCSKITLICSILTIFAFLPYIPLDKQLHPEIGIIFYFRIGLSVTGLIVFILQWIPFFKTKGFLLLLIIELYLEIVAGIIAGLTGGDSVYFGGLLFILMIIPMIPFPRFVSLSVLYAAVALYLGIGLNGGLSFQSAAARYNMNDIFVTALVATVFIFIFDKMRFNSWQKSKRIEEQKRQAMKDREQINTLLLNILPTGIVMELKEHGIVKPVCYDSATVVFADLIDFTKSDETVTPNDIVEELDRAFRYFDSIMGRFHLEKMKTIGDKYMFTGGIPEKNNTHAIDAVLAAIEMKRFVSSQNIEERKAGFKSIRIGISTGMIMAGVVGDKKFLYDVWGDAVNVASRIESTGFPGVINVSEKTYDQIKDFFEVDFKGKVKAKNKSEIGIYSVKGLKNKYQAVETGMPDFPNKLFWADYAKIAEMKD